MRRKSQRSENASSAASVGPAVPSNETPPPNNSTRSRSHGDSIHARIFAFVVAIAAEPVAVPIEKKGSKSSAEGQLMPEDDSVPGTAHQGASRTNERSRSRAAAQPRSFIVRMMSVRRMSTD